MYPSATHAWPSLTPLSPPLQDLRRLREQGARLGGGSGGPQGQPRGSAGGRSRLLLLLQVSYPFSSLPPGFLYLFFHPLFLIIACFAFGRFQFDFSPPCFASFGFHFPLHFFLSCAPVFSPAIRNLYFRLKIFLSFNYVYILE